MPLDLQRPSIVYRMTSPSGKKYIGLTSSPLRERMYAHKSCAASSGARALYGAISKYGFDSFVVEEIYRGTFAQCVAFEKESIANEGTKVPFGYNIADGGEGSPGVKHSAEVIAKRVLANTGRKRSAEFSIRIGNVHRGKVVSRETRLKLSEAAKRRAARPEEKARLIAIGTRHSQETLDKIRKANSGHVPSQATKMKMSEAQKERQSSTELRARMAESVRKSWIARKSANASS